MSPETPWNDAADQLRPVEPEVEGADLDEEAAVGRDAPTAVTPTGGFEADPADVADQQRAVPLPDDQPDPDRF
ncbi:hypothetical protein [Saccharothrix syringae]|uniref:Uncharacterized protein n=1 Tax=Saccharothrix syringae TaxID=103733 RepID=A0A5Q0GVB0_SACSY|nr:hypothetical protein [Saccharothrix syringae]QFZ17434.1 hypothetical protein EKG83_08045 [Saccharothrix syringae]